MRYRPGPILWLACAALVTTSATRGFDSAALGSLDFPNSGAAEAQEPFLRGVLLLHSFEFEDAAEAFREAQQIDPDFALAYWGEAMSFNHPLWREQDVAAARAVLERLAPTPQERAAKVPTGRERGYLEAVEILFGEGDKQSRDVAYHDAMQRLSERFPDDLEAKSFAALAILGTTDGVRDFRTYMKAAALAEEVFAVNPRHPGAAHYLIHSYDDPIHAPLGLRAARVYADIAPAASHAQHMISHIFVALGDWEDSIDSNVEAFEVSQQRAARKGLGVDSLNYHALQWLGYSYLQLGDLANARQRLDAMAGFAAESGSRRAAWHHAMMRAAWIIETGGSDVPPAADVSPLSRSGAVQNAFADGYAAWKAGDLSGAESAHAEIVRRLGETESADDLEEQKLQVLAKSLAALIALREEQVAEAMQLLDQAPASESSLPLEYGPPDIVKPSHELYGEILLELGRPSEARQQFEAALARAPRRSRSLRGLAQTEDQVADRQPGAAGAGD